jgi:hypothetical protein
MPSVANGTFPVNQPLTEKVNQGAYCQPKWVLHASRPREYPHKYFIIM